MRKLLLALAFVIAAPLGAFAQSGSTLGWDYNVGAAEVATYAQVVTVDGAVRTGTPNCVAVAGAPPPGKTTCTMNIGTLSLGTHTIVVTASKDNQSSAGQVTLDTNNQPASPQNIRITVTVVIQQ